MASSEAERNLVGGGGVGRGPGWVGSGIAERSTIEIRVGIGAWAGRTVGCREGCGWGCTTRASPPVADSTAPTTPPAAAATAIATNTDGHHHHHYHHYYQYMTVDLERSILDCYSTTLLDYYSTTLTHYHSTTLLYYYNTALLHYCSLHSHLERRRNETERSMAWVIWEGRLLSGKRMMVKSVSEVKALDAVSFSEEAAPKRLKVATVTKMGAAPETRRCNGRRSFHCSEAIAWG